MENTYGIGVANRYALFLDDESNTDLLAYEVLTKEPKKKATAEGKAAAKGDHQQTTPGGVQPSKGKPQQPAGPKKPAKDSGGANTNATPRGQDNKRDDAKQNHPRTNNADGKPERNFNKFNNESREEKNNRRNREGAPYNGPAENRNREDRPPRRDGGGDNFDNRNRGERRDGERRDGERRDGRGIGNKPGGPRGQRRTFDDRRGKREFDRQSGSDKTGVKPIDKRDGAGPHNWGSHKDIIEEADRPTNEADQSWNYTDKPETTQTDATKEEPEAESTAPVEEEMKELTLDEYKAIQRAGRAMPQYNLRKAGEGEDPTQWKKMYELRKKENEEESEEEEYDAAEYPQRVGRQKPFLDIDIQFYDNRRPGGGRGGRGGRGPRGNRPNQRTSGPGPDGGRRENEGRDGEGRGRRDRDGAGGGGGGGGERVDRAERRYRNDEQAEERTENRRAPKVDDERDFPSLG